MRLFVTAEGGDARAAPEHSLAAYRAAAVAGADALGICVRRSGDGVVVVSRTAMAAAGPVHARSRAELPELCTLADVVAELADAAELEIHLASAEPELVADVLGVLAGADLDRIVLTSPYAAVLTAAAGLEPDLVRGLFLPLTAAVVEPDVLGHEAVSRARLARADAVHLHPTQVNPEVLRQLDVASLAAHVWGADDPAEVSRLAALGVRRFSTHDVAAVLPVRDGPG